MIRRKEKKKKIPNLLATSLEMAGTERCRFGLVFSKGLSLSTNIQYTYQAKEQTGQQSVFPIILHVYLAINYEFIITVAKHEVTRHETCNASQCSSSREA